MTARCALYMDALKISGDPGYAHGYFSRNCSWAFVVIDRMKVRTKFEVRSFTRSWDNSGYLKILGSPWMRRSRSSSEGHWLWYQSKARMRFLLVRHSNLGPILHGFGDITGLLCSWVTPPLFHPNFGVFPLHQMAHVGVSSNRGLKLFGREIIFDVSQPMSSRYTSTSQTDIQTTCCGITALCVASRGNKPDTHRTKYDLRKYFLLNFCVE